jgi:hypothetical protein
MSCRKLALCVLSLLLAHSAAAMPSPQSDAITAKADTHAQSITDAAAFVEEVNQTLANARQGLYGSIKEHDVERLDEAQDTIANLLDGEESAAKLPPDERIALYNAQEVITSILRNDEKNRKVCLNIKTTGSRITKRECLTVAQREARAKAAREAAARAQRLDCSPGETSSCGLP